MALAYAMDSVCEHYGWQGVSVDSIRPASDCLGGRKIPPISESLLQAVERPAERLASLLKGVKPYWEFVPAAVEWDRKASSITGEWIVVANTLKSTGFTSDVRGRLENMHRSRHEGR